MFYFKDKATGAVVSFEAEHDAAGVRRQREYAEISRDEYEAIRADFQARADALAATAEADTPAPVVEAVEEVEVIAPAKPAKAPAKPKARRKGAR